MTIFNRNFPQAVQEAIENAEAYVLHCLAVIHRRNHENNFLRRPFFDAWICWVDI